MDGFREPSDMRPWERRGLSWRKIIPASVELAALGKALAVNAGNFTLDVDVLVMLCAKLDHRFMAPTSECRYEQ